MTKEAARETVSPSGTCGVVSTDESQPHAPPSRCSRYLSRHERWVIGVLGLVLIGSVAHAFASNLTWLVPFFGDLVHWLAAPVVAGGPNLPAKWWDGLLIYACALVIGAQLASLICKGTILERRRAAVAGLSLVLGPCCLGILAILAEVTGLLYGWVLALLIATVFVITSVAWAYSRSKTGAFRRRAEDVATLHSRGWTGADVALWSIVGFVVAATLIHVAMSPITEWDAVVYHAGTAKLWFLGRPSPHLVYGPSVGIEISANYPPLFPATGAFFDVILNRFQDIYLRILPPIVLLGMLLTIHAYTDRRYGRSVARWTVLMMLGCPLIIMYGSWPTAYIYLAALTTLGIIVIDLAVENGRWSTWTWAGVVTGLACLSSFYGAMLVGVAAIAVVIFHLWRQRGFSTRLLCYLAASIAVFFPWGLRNMLLLDDPVYPLLSPPFHAKGLVQPMWTASESEIRNNALGYWTLRPPAHVGFGLHLQELGSALFDRNLLLAGFLFAVLVGLWLASRGDRRSLFLSVSILALVGVQLGPGWYWLRALLYAAPIAALLSARGISLLLRHVTPDSTLGLYATKHRARSWLATHRKPAISIGLASLACITGISLAIIGTATPTWPTDLTSSDDLMQAVRNLGSTSNTLNYVFPGDYEAWQWLNARVGAHGRVATLENQMYYFHRPEELFYLDGREARPLIHMSSPSNLIKFFRHHGVDYIFSVSWTSAPGPARYSILKSFPFVHLLGGPYFPLKALYPTGIGPTIDMIYHVGQLPRNSAPPQVAIYSGIGSEFAAVPVHREVTIKAGDTTPRIYVLAGKTPEDLEIQYRQSGGGSVALNAYYPGAQKWIYGPRLFDHEGPLGWTTVSVPVAPPDNASVAELGMYAAGSNIEIRSITLVKANSPILTADGKAATNEVTVRPRDTSPRLIVPVPHGQTISVSFSYYSNQHERLDINELDAQGKWHYNVVPFTTTERSHWTKVTFAVPSYGAFFVQLGIYAPKAPVMIRGVSAVAL